jgi:hypothetical protein
MSTRNHNNRSEKQKGHVPDKSGQSDDDNRYSTDAGPKPRQSDGGGGAPRHQGQGQARNRSGQNTGHG